MLQEVQPIPGRVCDTGARGGPESSMSFSYRLLLVVAALALARGSAAQIRPHGEDSWDAAGPPAFGVGPDGARQVRGEVLAVLREGADRQAVALQAAALGVELVGEVPRARLMRFALPAGLDEGNGTDFVGSLDGVLLAERHGVGRGGGVTLPDDTFFESQWHLLNVGQTGGTPGADVSILDGWAIERGSPLIRVAVLDTGVDFLHPDLDGRLQPGFDFVNEDGDATADHPHGVWVTGLLAANAADGFGVAGVDRGCSVVPVKVLDATNTGTVFDLVQGIDWAAEQQIPVVSMSLVDYPASGALAVALGEARAAGSILLACSGNGGLGDADVSWPGASPDTLSIGATDASDARASSSGTGAALDFVAPGELLVTVDDQGFDNADLFSGCSAATPVAAGIVSLLLALDPTLDQDGAAAWLAAGALDEVGPPSEDTPGPDPFFGKGRLDAAASMQALCGCVEAPPLRGLPPVLEDGGQHELVIDVGSGHAAESYWLLGSATGTVPGMSVGGLPLPLNSDPYLSLTALLPNTFIASSLGTLDDDGRAVALLTIPSGLDPILSGLVLNHAAVVFAGAGPSSTTTTTNAVPVELTVSEPAAPGDDAPASGTTPGP